MSCEQYPAADEQSVWPGDHGNPYRDGGNPSPEGSGPLPPVPDVESDQGDADESGEREGKLLTECSVVPSGALFAWRIDSWPGSPLLPANRVGPGAMTGPWATPG